MRIVSIITAFLVIGALYLFVFERERLMEYTSEQTLVPASSQNTDATETETADASDATEPNAAEPDMPAHSVVSVVVLKSETSNIADAVLVRGRTEAYRDVEVRSEATGLVISEPLRKGQAVERGQLLCQLDSGTREVMLQEAKARLPEAEARLPEAQAGLPEAEARLSEAQSKVVEASINLRAAKKLAEGGFASDTRVASAEAANQAALAAVTSAKSGLETAKAGVAAAKAGVLSAKAGIAAAEKAIEDLNMTAPFSGYLESDTAETGSLLQPGALCATIIQLDPIKLVGYVAEADVNRVKVGTLAGARLASGQEVQGTVIFLSRSADETTRTFRVEVQVPNPDLDIRDGQTVEIIISSDGEDAHLLPQSALTLDNDGNLGVRTVDADNIVRFNEVHVVRDTPDGVWLTGLPETVDVIVVGQEYVTEGVPVKVTYKKVES